MAAALLGAVLIVSMMPVRVLAKDRTGEGWRDKVEITAHRGTTPRRRRIPCRLLKPQWKMGLTGLNWM